MANPRHFKPLHIRRRAVMSGTPLEGRTVAQLEEDAESLGLDLPTGARKDAIIAAIRGKPAPAQPVEATNPADAEEE